MLWAIGFITGHVIAVPLAVGAIAQIMLVSPLHTHFFSQLSTVEFTLAFCSGMVLIGAALGFVSLPHFIKKTIHSLRGTSSRNFLGLEQWKIAGAALLATVVFLTYFQFSLPAQLFIGLSTLIWTYQTVVVAGKIGLATLGRYATFVMIPAMIMFKLNSVQIVIVATFVSLWEGFIDLFYLAESLLRWLT